MDKKIIIVAVAGTVFLIPQFYILSEWTENRQQELIETFFQGYDQGLENAVETIYNRTENCNTVPIFIDNQTKYLIDISCIGDNVRESAP